MCTVSFLPVGPDAYLFASNRDELKTRKKAIAPEIHIVNGVRCLWPIDGEAGGTWIAVNEYGCAYTLMNDYQNQGDEQNQGAEQDQGAEQKQGTEQNQGPERKRGQDQKRDQERKRDQEQKRDQELNRDQELKRGQEQSRESEPSRGAIISGIADCTSKKEVSSRLSRLIESPFQPFRLLMSDTKNGVTMWHFNGEHLQEFHQSFGAGLWVSAGKYEAQVLDRRRGVFEAFLKKEYSDDLDRIKELHTSKNPEPGPFAISMELDTVQSVSATIIEVRLPDFIGMHYMPGLPSPQKKWQKYAL